MTTLAPDTAARATLFGHPRALTFLFTTEMWERFSYYGMRSLLVLYLVKHLFAAPTDTIVGLATLKAGLEAVFGPLAAQPLASQIYGLYTGLVYLAPVLGGVIADRWFGRRRCILLGAALMALGHFLMAFETLLLPALFALILGSGAFKPNISCQVGTLYAQGDPRRDRAYSIFYIGINVGAFFSPLVCGTLGEVYGWHYGFASAGVGMLIGLIVYACAAPYLPDDKPPARRARAPAAPLTRDERRAIFALLVLLVPVSFYWACYEQQGNTLSLWADERTDRTLNLLLITAEIPTTWFQAFNPFMIFAFTPGVVALWAWQARRRREPSPVVKMALGCFALAFANLILVAAAVVAGDGKASWLWILAYFVVLTVGELYLSPIGLSLVSKMAPARILSMMMGIWFLSSFAGGLLTGWLGSYWSAMDKTSFFLMIAGIAAVAGAVILAFDRPLRPMLDAGDDTARG